MLQDYKLAFRILLKYPGLTVAGGLALAVAIAIAVARAVIVNEAFLRGFRLRGWRGSPIGARLRYSDRSAASAAEPWFEIVGVVRDLGLDRDDEGDELPYVFHPASAGTISPLVMIVRMRGNPAPLIPRLSIIATGVDALRET